MNALPDDLPAWLEFISRQHSSEIELGLDRLKQVADCLHLSQPSCPLITVAGTNGKGSSITALEKFYLVAGYETACYTSPHLSIFNERVRVSGKFVSDKILCAAFAEINAARGSIPLTYFEFATLAAFVIFSRQQLDVMLLEVGLGGRLDATNLFAADLALITSIGIDHTAWLGNDRETISIEKAGIIHQGKIAVISDPDPTKNLLNIAQTRAESVYVLKRDFHFSIFPADWRWQQDDGNVLNGLPLTGLHGEAQYNNLAGVLMCLSALAENLPVSEGTIRSTLPDISLSGRFQIISERPMIIADVAHNPDSMALLAGNLNSHPVTGTSRAVVAMLKDKDITASLQQVYPLIDVWYVSGLSAERGESPENLKAILEKSGSNTDIRLFDTVDAAWQQAGEEMKESDRLVVFGSFHTVGVIINSLSS